jgi:hypothetical protein
VADRGRRQYLPNLRLRFIDDAWREQYERISIDRLIDFGCRLNGLVGRPPEPVRRRLRGDDCQGLDTNRMIVRRDPVDGAYW